MNALTSDFIAIDTNVFEHLLNPQNNTNNHISKLFIKLMDDKITLLVDDKDRIVNEYSQKIERILDEKDEMGDAVKILGTTYLYFMDHKQPVPVVSHDSLMTAIKSIIKKKKKSSVTDRFFVYVAFKSDRILITNDKKDMIDERNQKGKRKQKLLKMAKKQSLKRADILTSESACEKLNMANGA